MNFAQKTLVLASVTTVLSAVSSASAADPRRIEGVALRGQAEVTIVPANRIDVRVQRDERRQVSIAYERGSIRITGCMSRCDPRALPRVQVAMPKVSALAVDFGGSVRVARGYPALRELAVAIDGSGLVDTLALDAQRVAVSVDGRGAARVRVRNSLAVSVEGPGRVLYAGSPPQVASSTRQGGRLERIGS
jgi:hypothetical protein